MIFTIDQENNITAHDSRQSATGVSDAQVFASAKDLGKLAAEWPADRLVAIWNSLAGVKGVKKFTSRAAGVNRIWKTIQSLGSEVSTAAPAKTTRKQSSKAAQAKPVKARDDSKKAQVIEMLSRKDGASLADIMQTTGWQAHSVRGFISGALIRKTGLPVESFKRDDGERVYRIAK